MRKIGTFLTATLLGGVVFMFPIVIVFTLFKKSFEILMHASGLISKLVPDMTIGDIDHWNSST